MFDPFYACILKHSGGKVVETIYVKKVIKKNSRCRVKNSPPQKVDGSDFITDGDRETIAPRQFIHVAVCEKIAPYCLIVRNSPPRRRLFKWGRFFHVVTKTFLLWKTRPSVVTLVVLRMIWNQLIWNRDLKSFWMIFEFDLDIYIYRTLIAITITIWNCSYNFYLFSTNVVALNNRDTIDN